MRSFFNRKLRRNDDVVRAIEARFRSFKRDMPAVNLRQAMVPEGAEVLENPRGTAPGLWLEDDGRMIALLPGPPRELKPLFLEQVLPRLQRRISGIRMFKRELRVTGLGESHVEERIRPIYTRYGDVNTTILATPGEIQIHLRVWTEDAIHAESTLDDEMVSTFELALGDHIFAHSATPLEHVIAEILTTHRATIAAAESCTAACLRNASPACPAAPTIFSAEWFATATN